MVNNWIKWGQKRLNKLFTIMVNNSQMSSDGVKRGQMGSIDVT